MSNNQVVVVVASNFESFIGSMKANLKLGYATCSEATYMNGFFRARLEKGVDDNYIARLETITGTERESVLDLVDFISGQYVPITQEFVAEINEILDLAEENKKKDAVNTTIKRVRKPRGKKNV